MFTSKSRIKAENFVKHITWLNEDSSNKMVGGFQETEKELINKFTAEAEELIAHNEWVIALENLLSNLYEVDFSLDSKAIHLAKDAIAECDMNYDDWIFIEELARKENP